ncbi:DUF11 domain-containing protein [Parahaliea mediterranea]|uniref:DUF11 domain-containing protein n=1 Tax=Parahaliea mediterranea TaxID=651086 RepID=UPI0014766BD7|nr:DUF11 domain-containing protein [Parahaliea mediterranea]
MPKLTSPNLRLPSVVAGLLLLLLPLALLLPHTAFAQGPELTLNKSASKSSVSPGGTVVYTISIANTGFATATNVVLEDLLPVPRLNFVSATGGGLLVGGDTVEWRFASIAPGQTGSVTLTAEAGNFVGTTILNEATISSDQTPPTTSNSVPTKITDLAELTLTKTVNTTLARPGDALQYTLAFANTGSDAAANVTLTDDLPAGIQFVSASGGGVESAGTVSWNIGTLAAGQSGSVVLSGTVNSGIVDGALITNAATIDSSTVDVGPVTSNSVQTEIDNAALLAASISATPSPALAGDVLTFTVTVRNDASPATGVTVRANVPAQTSYLSHSPGGNYDGSGQVTWAVGELATGASAQVSLTVQVDAPLPDDSQLSFGASVSADNATTAGAGVIVFVSSRPALNLQKTAAVRAVTPGELLTYTLSYSNTGTDREAQATLEDNLPPETTYQSSTGGGTHAGGVVTWNLGEVAAGASGSVAVTVRVNDGVPGGTVLHNAATLSGLSGLPVSAPVVDVLVSDLPDLRLDKTTSASTVQAGGEITYTLAYENRGASPATNVTLGDPLPQGTRFVAASDGGTASGGAVIWRLGTLAPGASGSVSLTLGTEPGLADGTVIANSASIDSNETPPAATSRVTTLVEADVIAPTAPVAVPAVPGPLLLLVGLVLLMLSWRALHAVRALR